MARRRPILTLAITAMMVSGCIESPRKPYRRSPSEPVGTTDPAALRQCVATLDRIVARYALLPDRRFENGCSALGSVQLRDIGTPTTNLGAMTCPLARAFTLWVQNDLQTPAMAEFGSPIARIETYGTYACRPIAGTARLSEHASSNAVDISAFVLADGRRISVLGGWQGDTRDRRFLRSVHSSACRRFQTVLGPNYNADHRDHLHFDMGRGLFCR